MKHYTLRAILQLSVLLVSYMAQGQDSIGPRPKRARTPEDYKRRTLAEVAVRDSDADSGVDGEQQLILYGDIFPSRVKVTYAGRARRLPKNKQEVLHSWAQRYAGAPTHYTVPYQTELLFKDDGRKYWLAVRKESAAQLAKDIKKGASVELYLIRLGGTGPAEKWEPLLLVESYAKAK